MVDEAFLRRLGYRARIDPPSTADYIEIFKRAAAKHKIAMDQSSLSHLLAKYTEEGRAPKSCEPRDLLNRVSDICQFRGLALQSDSRTDRSRVEQLLWSCSNVA